MEGERCGLWIKDSGPIFDKNHIVGPGGIDPKCIFDKSHIVCGVESSKWRIIIQIVFLLPSLPLSP